MEKTRSTDKVVGIRIRQSLGQKKSISSKLRISMGLLITANKY